MDVDAATSPELTAILTVDVQRKRGEIALQAMLAQTLLPRMEILILDRGLHAHPPLNGSEHPNVRTVLLDGRCGYGEALASGVAAARCPVVAFVEEHVQVFPDWAAALVEAHHGPWVAVCGEIYPGHLDQPAAIRTELVSRQRWSAPARGGEAAVLRWQNVSYKREVLLGLGDRLPQYLQSEGALFRRLRREGGRLYIEPAAKMVHAHEYSTRVFLTGTLYSSRSGAASAARVLGRGLEGFWRPFASALVGPLRWPLVLYRRTRELPDAKFWTGVYWRNFSFVLLYYAMAALGTLQGLLLGAGDSSARFLDFEINEPRLIPNLADFVDARRG
jgi:GT2 family glycosyltransferase